MRAVWATLSIFAECRIPAYVDVDGAVWLEHSSAEHFCTMANRYMDATTRHNDTAYAFTRPADTGAGIDHIYVCFSPHWHMTDDCWQIDVDGPYVGPFPREYPRAELGIHWTILGPR